MVRPRTVNPEKSPTESYLVVVSRPCASYVAVCPSCSHVNTVRARQTHPSRHRPHNHVDLITTNRYAHVFGILNIPYLFLHKAGLSSSANGQVSSDLPRLPPPYLPHAGRVLSPLDPPPPARPQRQYDNVLYG